MTWKEKTIYRILLIIAKHLSEGDLKTDIGNLANHVSLGEKN
ncbi:hypothetical protein [Occallatibacter riparius]|nr:hypothetical protein [Occallatibacter riparius]